MLTAIDTDVIKTHVGIGSGVGIIASMGYEPDRDRDFGGAGRQPSVRAVHHQDLASAKTPTARLCLYLY